MSSTQRQWVPAMATKVRALLGPDNNLTAFDVVVNSAPHTNRPGAGGYTQSACRGLPGETDPARTVH